jgi:DNA-binding CsgD family transcriptional regulator
MPRLPALLGYGALAGVLLLCLKLISLAPLAVDWGRELAGATLALLAVAVGWRLAHRQTPQDAPRTVTTSTPSATASESLPHPPATASPDATTADASPAASEPAAASREPLSPREHAVLRLLGEGRSNKEIARALHLSENTVKTHLAKVYGKLGVGRRTEALAVALQRGLL